LEIVDAFFAISYPVYGKEDSCQAMTGEKCVGVVKILENEKKILIQLKVVRHLSMVLA